MVVLEIIGIVVTVAFFAWEVYQQYELQPEDNKQIGDAFADAVDETLQDLVNAFNDLANAIADAVTKILQYMDAWGTVIVVLFAVVIVILLAMFFNVAKLRRSR